MKRALAGRLVFSLSAGSFALLALCGSVADAQVMPLENEDPLRGLSTPSLDSFVQRARDNAKAKAKQGGAAGSANGENGSGNAAATSHGANNARAGSGTTFGGANNASPGTGTTFGGANNASPGTGTTSGGANNASPGTGTTFGGANNASPGAGITFGGANNAGTGSGTTFGGANHATSGSANNAATRNNAASGGASNATVRNTTTSAPSSLAPAFGSSHGFADIGREAAEGASINGSGTAVPASSAAPAAAPPAMRTYNSAAKPFVVPSMNHGLTPASTPVKNVFNTPPHLVPSSPPIEMPALTGSPPRAMSSQQQAAQQQAAQQQAAQQQSAQQQAARQQAARQQSAQQQQAARQQSAQQQAVQQQSAQQQAARQQSAQQQQQAAQQQQLEPLRAPVAYQRWTDPMQSAFGLMVPQGWQIMGGMVQPSTLDVRPEVQAVSPDGSMIVFMGDSKLPMFTMPAPVLNFAGYRVGSTYSPGAGVQTVIEPYEPAAKFLATYGPNRMRRTNTNVMTDWIQDEPALAARTHTIYDQTPVPGVRSTFTMADGHFHFLRHNQPYVGFLIVGVQAAYGAGPGTWLVPHLWGYVSTPEREQQASRVMEMMMSTFQLNMQWVARTNQNSAGAVRATEETNRAMIASVNAACQRSIEATAQFCKTEARANTVVMDGWKQRMDTQSKIANEWSNTILGIHTVEDPNTGERRTVDNGYNYYWKDKSGNVIGTQTYSPPSAGCTQMNILKGQ